MKKLQKFILPLMILLVVGIIYLFYFSPHRGLGSFSSFDPNSHAQKDIVVEPVHDRGIQQDASGHRVIFFAKDKDGVEMQVECDITDGLEKAETITMTGHIHGGIFSATKIEINE